MEKYIKNIIVLLKMRKKDFFVVFLGLLLLIILCTGGMAKDLPAIIIESEPINRVAPLELKIPADFKFKIRNNNVFEDNIELFTLLDIDFYPKGPWHFEGLSEKEFILNVDPKDNKVGLREISYFVKSSRLGNIEKKILIEVKPMSEILSINMPEDFTKDFTRLPVRIKNNEKTYFGDVKLKIVSEFLEKEEEIFIDREGGAEISLDLDQKTLKGLELKPYSFEFIFTFKTGEEWRQTLTSELKETVDLEINEIRTNNIWGQKINLEKTNNADFNQMIVTRHNMFGLTKLLTSFSKKPTYTKLEGLTNVAVWEETLEPSQKFELEIKNYYLILIYILIIIIAAILIPYIITKKRILIKKKVKKIKARGSDFVIRVTLRIKNKGKEAKNLTVVDFLPHLAKLHEDFQGMKPSKITHNSITWKIPKLGKKEEIFLSYIIYSKVEVMGKFIIPKASLSFKDKNKKTVIEKSNESFIYSEVPEIKKEQKQ